MPEVEQDRYLILLKHGLNRLPALPDKLILEQLQQPMPITLLLFQRLLNYLARSVTFYLRDPRYFLLEIAWRHFAVHCGFGGLLDVELHFGCRQFEAALGWRLVLAQLDQLFHLRLFIETRRTFTQIVSEPFVFECAHPVRRNLPLLECGHFQLLVQVFLEVLVLLIDNLRELLFECVQVLAEFLEVGLRGVLGGVVGCADLADFELGPCYF